MRIDPRASLLSLIGAVALGAATAGTVSVSFVNAPGYSDAGTTSWERDANLRALDEHLQGLGRRYLPPDQVLRVEVLDVDLAGTTRPSRRSGSELRILKGGADWPRISLRYTLETPGKPPLRGQESVADLNYLGGIAGARGAEPLYYEKHMLDGWFKARFVEHRAAAD